MGLFDTVRCQARVPGSELLGDGEFQTSDLGRWCDRFTIDISGNLVHHRTRNQPEKPLWRYMTDRDIAIPIRASASKVDGVMNAVSVDSSSAGKFSVRGGLGIDGATRWGRRVDCKF